MSQKFSVQAEFVLPCKETSLGSRVSVEVTASELAAFVEAAERPLFPVEGAEVVTEADTKTVLEPGDATWPEAGDWL